MNLFRASHKTQVIRPQNPYFSNLSCGVCLQNSYDYSPFGVSLDERTVESDFYRRGYNGMEKDDEFKGKGNSYDFGARMYDSRVGRWLKIDPMADKYPELSTYCFVANSAIAFIDPDGKDIIIHYKEDGVGKTFIYVPNSTPPPNLFVQQAVSSLNESYNRGGDIYMDELINSDDNLNIIEKINLASPRFVSFEDAIYKNRIGEKFDGEKYIGNSIYWSPSQSAIQTKLNGREIESKSISASRALFHEIAHGFLYQSMGLQKFENSRRELIIKYPNKKSIWKWGNIQEKMATKIENKVWEKIDGVRRTSHRGKGTVQTPQNEIIDSNIDKNEKNIDTTSSTSS
jgi:RHS repeat-associated protein